MASSSPQPAIVAIDDKEMSQDARREAASEFQRSLTDPDSRLDSQAQIAPAAIYQDILKLRVEADESS
jgi:hypothetical protein